MPGGSFGEALHLRCVESWEQSLTLADGPGRIAEVTQNLGTPDAFRPAAYTDAMINDLVARGYPAFYYKIKVDGMTYYRVRCGVFDNRGEATEYAKKLQDNAGMKGFVSRIN